MNINIVTREEHDALKTTIDMILAAVTKSHDESINLLEVIDAAKKLRVCEKTVRSYIENGKLTAVNLNKGTALRPIYKIEESELRSFIKARRTK